MGVHKRVSEAHRGLQAQRRAREVLEGIGLKKEGL